MRYDRLAWVTIVTMMGGFAFAASFKGNATAQHVVSAAIAPALVFGTICGYRTVFGLFKYGLGSDSDPIFRFYMSLLSFVSTCLAIALVVISMFFIGITFEKATGIIIPGTPLSW